MHSLMFPLIKGIALTQAFFIDEPKEDNWRRSKAQVERCKNSNQPFLAIIQVSRKSSARGWQNLYTMIT